MLNLSNVKRGVDVKQNLGEICHLLAGVVVVLAKSTELIFVEFRILKSKYKVEREPLDGE